MHDDNANPHPVGTGRETVDTVASVIAELAAYGPFLPGSVRKTTQKGRPRKDGTRKTYPSSPIFTWTDPDTGRQRSRRIPARAFGQVKALTARYAGAKALLKRLLAAARREALENVSKKTAGVAGPALSRAHGGSVGGGRGERAGGLRGRS